MLQEIKELCEQGLSVREIAEKLNKKYHTIYAAIKKHNLMKVSYANNGKSEATLKARKKARKLTKQQVERMYITQKMSMQEIADKTGVEQATVLNTLRRYNIPTRLHNGQENLKKAAYPKKVLEKLYLDKQLSMQEIADLLDYKHHGEVQQDLIRHNIPTRNYKEAGKVLYEKRPEKRELHRRQFYERIATNPEFFNKGPTNLEFEFIKWAERNNIEYEEQFQIRPNWHRYDFRICNTNILVEVDGEYWHSKPEHVERDQRFDETAKRYGYIVCRVKEKDIMLNSDEAFGIIQESIKEDINAD